MRFWNYLGDSGAVFEICLAKSVRYSRRKRITLWINKQLKKETEDLILLNKDKKEILKNILLKITPEMEDAQYYVEAFIAPQEWEMIKHLKYNVLDNDTRSQFFLTYYYGIAKYEESK